MWGIAECYSCVCYGYDEIGKVNGCWGRVGMAPSPQDIDIGGPTVCGHPNKPLWLTLSSSLMIRGLEGKDPFEALASPRMVGDHHAV